MMQEDNRVLYSLEKLEAEAKEYRARAEILMDARSMMERETKLKDAAEAIKAVKKIFILRGVNIAAEWALNNVSDFAFDSKKAIERVERIVEQEKSGEDVLDKLCDYYRTQRGARQQRRHDPQFLMSMAKEWERAANLIREGQKIRREKNLQELDENTIIKEVKKKYIETQSAGKTSEWAFENIPGFAKTISRAKERINWIIDKEKSGEDDLDKTCERVRSEKKKRAAAAT